MGKTTINAPAEQPFIDIERDFDAPRDLVYRAYCDPALIKQWLGPRKYEMVIDRWDARDGGSYRYVHRDGESAYGFHGVFHSMDMDNMVQTFEFEGAPGHVSLDTQALIDLGNGRTRIKSHSIFMSVADRDMMVENGMSEGVEDGYDRLDELLARLQQPVGAAG
jgi:uncharacterized protein YndB with AHSA1/START domain